MKAKGGGPAKRRAAKKDGRRQATKAGSAEGDAYEAEAYEAEAHNAYDAAFRQRFLLDQDFGRALQSAHEAQEAVVDRYTGSSATPQRPSAGPDPKFLAVLRQMARARGVARCNQLSAKQANQCGDLLGRKLSDLESEVVALSLAIAAARDDARSIAPPAASARQNKDGRQVLEETAPVHRALVRLARAMQAHPQEAAVILKCCSALALEEESGWTRHANAPRNDWAFLAAFDFNVSVGLRAPIQPIDMQWHLRQVEGLFSARPRHRPAGSSPAKRIATRHLLAAVEHVRRGTGLSSEKARAIVGKLSKTKPDSLKRQGHRQRQKGG